MQFQNMPPNWTRPLLKMPRRKVGFKTIDQTGAIKQAKELWAADGRDPRELVTCFRHYNIKDCRTTDWNAAVAHWRGQFPRFVDGTYRERYAPFIDRVQGANETTANSTWDDPGDKARALTSERAMAWVWNNDYRGKIVPASCKIVLLSSPVTNYVPREIFQLSVEQDCPIDYRAYWLCVNGQPGAGDWRYHSGLWHFQEQEYGIYPEWDFGEAGPYDGTAPGGWRAASCLGGNKGLMADSFRRFIRNVMGTRAYAEGRVTTPYSYVSGNAGWPNYELTADELDMIADVYTSEGWNPGDDMDAELRAKIKTHAQAIIDLLADKPDPLRALTNQAVINLFDRAFGRLPVGADPAYIAAIKRAMTAAQWNLLFASRTAAYTGPSIAAMSALTQAERDKLAAAL